MEQINIISGSEDCRNLDQAFERNFGAGLKATLPDAGDLTFVPLRKGTLSGLPLVAITFTVELPGGKKARVQSVTTMRLFQQAALALRARYPEAGDGS